jgi:hypothetical protein
MSPSIRVFAARTLFVSILCACPAAGIAAPYPWEGSSEQWQPPRNVCVGARAIVRDEVGAGTSRPRVAEDVATTPAVVPGSALEVWFPGAPQWLNVITFESDLNPVRIDYLGPTGAWRMLGWRSGLGVGTSVSLAIGPIRTQALRFVPHASAIRGTRIASVSATLEQEDPDVPRPPPLLPHRLFTEWIINYSTVNARWGQNFSSLPETKGDAVNFEKQIAKIPGWGSVVWGQDNVWAKDWTSVAAGGANNDWADDYSLAYFSGHALPRGKGLRGLMSEIPFNVAKPNSAMEPTDCTGQWGDRDLEWVCFQSCDLLTDPADRPDWFGAFNGLHELLGWRSTVQDLDIYGTNFGYYLRPDPDPKQADPALTVALAYNRMVQMLWHFKRVIVIGETPGVIDSDYVWNAGLVLPDPPHDATFTQLLLARTWKWGGGVGPQPPAPPLLTARGPRGLNVYVRSAGTAAALDATSLPYYNVIPSTVDESRAALLAFRLCDDAEIFCDATTGPGKDGISSCAIDGDWRLRLWNEGGAPDILNDQLWMKTRTTAPDLPDSARAEQIADSLVVAWSLLPPGLVHDGLLRTRQETVTGSVVDPAKSFDLNIGVVYGRELPGGYPVAGPGGVLTVTLGDAGEFQSFQRGPWRTVTAGANTSIIPFSEVLSALAARGLEACISGVQGSYDGIEVVDHQLGYYEYGNDVHQTVLRPVYILLVNLLDGPPGPTQTSDQETVCVWADQPPLSAVVDEPADTVVVYPGATVCLAGHAVGGTPPYSYEWSSALSGIVSRSDDTCRTLPALSVGEKDGRTHSLVFRVRDALGSEAYGFFRVDVRVPSSVADDPGALRLALGANPGRGEGTIDFSLPVTGPVRMRVLDLSGRRIRDLYSGSMIAGFHHLTWNGTTDDGKHAAAGVYVFELSTSSGRRSVKFTLLR